MTHMITISIDGTWMTSKDNTNVWRLHNMFNVPKENKLYLPGPGTDHHLLNKLFGGAFGLGTHKLVDQAHEWINVKIGQYGSHIVIIIIGFSRGATAARMLASRLAKVGIKVLFLGCYDTVGAMGIPINFPLIPEEFLPGFLKFQEINLFTDDKVHDNVIFAAHALSRDEKRAAFVHTRMRKRKGITQRTFKGDHGQIGTSDETLDFIWKQFTKAEGYFNST